MLKIVTVCGLGVGSSLILKMTVDSAMNQLGVKCDIEHWDMGTVKGKPCDLIVTTEEFRKNFADQDNVVYISNMVNISEAKDKLEKYLKEKEII
ncbi:MAG TPA: PTS sugar transporter subunit IIB [Erysipelotrichaceae bacterium]|jgi:PTS system ascorbate-specific IIB component|nr:PTS sugar transporter subunit IIB [Erysipelotrichia bacterium]HPX32150.1 PTS sugar transporter subunit IIB [Erysipelotrichaceae bacterium]HQA84517.1 PTS sugar transporter subunit IIB [Erysipelotrichaceae bacterium]